MPENEKFFAEQSEQSEVKVKIVSSYFIAWSRVIKTWASKMAYIDLFCGPGKYDNDKDSAPILILQHAMKDDEINTKIRFLFNDKDPNNIEKLKLYIKGFNLPQRMNDSIEYHSIAVSKDFERILNIPNDMSVLSFIDPFGYKGLTMSLINRLIANLGSDCIFFFNYNRINMAFSNDKFDGHLIELFGEERTQRVKKKLQNLSVQERELVVLDALIEALHEGNANYVLPFKFYSQEKKRTSHFIVFVAKHSTACKIMKQIMYANSSKDADGVAKFAFEDSHNFIQGLEQLSLFDKPIQTLKDKLIDEYKGKRVFVSELCRKADTDCTSNFVGQNVKTALKQLEEENCIVVESGRTRKYMGGKLTMPDNALIYFC